MDILNRIYGEIIGAELAVNIEHGNPSIIFGNASKRMLDEIQMTCKIHGIESGRIFLINNLKRGPTACLLGSIYPSLRIKIA